ncbi:MAG: PQQ-like beta-propeller repeat protein [Verrucomicrobia bacterium]|nr:PQQ-like beta-propeller repeat protein [Verrucomicrobiota bacterium]
MFRIANLISGAAIVFAASSVLGGQFDWPEWRGPDRDGVSSDQNLMTEWPAGGPEVVFNITGIGGGYSGVAVANGRIYTMGERESGSFLFALNEEDGEIIWEKQVGRAGAPGWGDFAGPRSTPTVDGERVYALSHYGELVCVEAEDGEEVWRVHLVDDLGGKRPEWGFAESPLVDGERLVCTPGGGEGAIAALNKQTGEVLWRTEGLTDEAGYSSIVIATFGELRQYVQLTPESVVGVDPASGFELWRAARKGKTAVIPTPVVKPPFIYVTSGYGAGCNLFKVTRNGTDFAVEEVYANKLIVNHHGGVVLMDGYIYGHSDTEGWVCQDLETGEAMWNERRQQRKGSIAGFPGHLILRAEANEGTVVLLKATPDGFTERGRFDQIGRSDKNSWPHPVIANGRLYLRDQGRLLAYKIRE